MRRAVFRSAWLMLLCVLVLAFSPLFMPAAPDTAVAQPSSPVVAATGTGCATVQINTDPAERLWVGQLLAAASCEPTPSTPLVARSRPAENDLASVGAAPTAGDTIILGNQ